MSDNENLSIITGPKPAPFDGVPTERLSRSTFDYRSTAVDEDLRDVRIIEGIYNAKRIHSALSYLPRNEFESQLARKAA